LACHAAALLLSEFDLLWHQHSVTVPSLVSPRPTRSVFLPPPPRFRSQGALSLPASTREQSGPTAAAEPARRLQVWAIHPGRAESRVRRLQERALAAASDDAPGRDP